MPATREDWSDFRRNFRWKDQIFGLLTGATWAVAHSQLRHATVIGSARLFWFLIPFPFLVISIWFGFRRWRQQRGNELERRVTREAATWAFGLTVLGLFVLGQVDSAYPLDHREWGYESLFVFPLLINLGASVLIFKRYNQQ